MDQSESWLRLGGNALETKKHQTRTPYQSITTFDTTINDEDNRQIALAHIENEENYSYQFESGNRTTKTISYFKSPAYTNNATIETLTRYPYNKDTVPFRVSYYSAATYKNKDGTDYKSVTEEAYYGTGRKKSEKITDTRFNKKDGSVDEVKEHVSEYDKKDRVTFTSDITLNKEGQTVDGSTRSRYDYDGKGVRNFSFSEIYKNQEWVEKKPEAVPNSGPAANPPETQNPPPGLAKPR